MTIVATGSFVGYVVYGFDRFSFDDHKRILVRVGEGECHIPLLLPAATVLSRN